MANLEKSQYVTWDDVRESSIHKNKRIILAFVAATVSLIIVLVLIYKISAGPSDSLEKISQEIVPELQHEIIDLKNKKINLAFKKRCDFLKNLAEISQFEISKKTLFLCQ